MSDPVIDPSDLATYLNDPDIDVISAAAFINDAQALCESIVSPLPAHAPVVVKRVAGRAYVTLMSPSQAQLAAVGAPYGPTELGNMDGVFLTAYDVADLRRLNSGGGAFSIDLLPTGYTAPVSWRSDVDTTDWDTPT